MKITFEVPVSGPTRRKESFLESVSDKFPKMVRWFLTVFERESLGVDSDNSDGWSWTIEDENDGYCEFYSIARDNSNNVEPAPSKADQTAGIDTTAPVISSVLIDDGTSTTDSREVTITIDAADNTSGLAEMQFSNDYGTVGPL